MDTKLERFGFALGRLLVSVIFILSGSFKIFMFKATADMMAAKGIPLTKVALVLTIMIELGGGILVATGFKARYAAIVMALFLVPVTLTFHNFWAYQGQQQQDQMGHFISNLAIMGGLAAIAAASRKQAPAKSAAA
jgi:putative oxidoreductase